MRFQSQQCPLCNQVLKLKSSCGVSTFYCPAENTEGGSNTSHYEVESDGKQTIQHFYAFPFAVDNYINATRSRIYHWKGTRWQFLTEVPRIDPQETGVLRQYLNLVVPHELTL